MMVSLRNLCLCLLLLLSGSLPGYAQTDTEKADELYDRIMEADGFNEALGYEILGDIYPEYEVLQKADQAYEQALQSDNPQEIVQVASQLAQQQYRPIARMQALIVRLRSLPTSAHLNRLLASVLLDYDRVQEEETVLDGAFFELLGAPDSTRLADPLDWIDPKLALEALLRRYRGPLPKGAPPEELQARLVGLQHCLSLLHELRRAQTQEADRLALAATVPPLAHRALVIALQLDQQQPQSGWRDQAFIIAEQAKATLLADQLQGYTTNREDLTWPKLEKQLRLARHLATQSGDFFATPQHLRSLIDQQLPELGHWPPRSTPSLSVASIQARLAKQDQLLISYFLLGHEGIAFHLDGHQVQVDHFYWNTETKAAWQQLREQLTSDQFLSEPKRAYAIYAESALWLYENLLQRPVLRHYRNVPQQLVLLPDGALWDIPFGALITDAPAEGQLSYHSDKLAYLINQCSLGFAPSAQAWYQLQTTKEASLRVAALAPDFSGDAMAARAACSSPLPALPNSAVEVKTITAQVAGKAFIGNDAKRQTLEQADDDFTIWHLATHACRNLEDPSQSAVFLQDGALTATQIAQLPLQLQLVVLSACETQSGPYRAGEGVLSIGRAFLQAGAQALIGSLWPVSDVSTAELMPLFYEQLAAGESTSEALRNAQLTFLSHQDRLTAHPHYWAGFVLVGPESNFHNSANGWLYWILGGLTLAGIFAIFTRSRR